MRQRPLSSTEHGGLLSLTDSGLAIRPEAVLAMSYVPTCLGGASQGQAGDGQPESKEAHLKGSCSVAS